MSRNRLKDPSPSIAALSLLLALWVSALLCIGCNPAPAPAPDSTPAAEQAPPQPVAAPSADAVELEYWKTIKESEHTQDFWSYLEKYPNGSFADLAKARIERISSGAAKSDKPTPRTTQSNSNRDNPGSGNIRSERKDVVRGAIRRELRGYSDRRLHIAPDIPRFKLDNVAGLHGLDQRRVILLYDDGSGGGGKTGFCLTDRRIYWRLIAGSDPYYIDYEDISQVRVSRSGFSVNGYDIPTSLAANSSLAAERFGDMLESIARDMRRR